MSDIVLATHGLTRAYGQSKALDNVSLTVRKGDIYGLVGRNGAGKTTLMRLVTGQSAPTSGSVELFGQTGRDLERARSRTGAMIETPSFAPFLTARENLEYYRIQRGIPGKGAVDEVLEQVDLHDTGKKKFKTFSLGMKQRLGLALALMNHPDFLILDEPINGLDPEGVAEFRALLRKLNQERQTTILIQTLHDKCRTCLHLMVDDAPRAAMILQTQLGTEKFEVLPNNVIELYDCLDRPQAVSGALSAGGVALLGMEQKGTDLEAYFLNLIGGGRNG